MAGRALTYLQEHVKNLGRRSRHNDNEQLEEVNRSGEEIVLNREKQNGVRVHEERERLLQSTISNPIYTEGIKEVIISNDIENCIAIFNKYPIAEVEQEIKENFLIHEAVRQKRVRILELMVEKVNESLLIQKETYLKNVTPLHLAINKKDLTMCKILISSLTLSQKDRDGETPIHYMARENFVEAYKESKKHSSPATEKISNKKGESPVHVAVTEHNIDILELLLENGNRADYKTAKRNTPLHYAADNGFFRCIEILLEHVPEENLETYMNTTNRENQTALILAAKKGFTECCRLLHKTNVNHQDNTKSTALHYACMKGSESIVEFLVQYRADPSIKDNKKQTPLYKAAAGDNSICLTHLLDHGGKTSDNHEELFLVAAEKNCYKVIEELLARKTFQEIINIQNTDGNTSLHLAVKNRNFEVAHLLLNNGARKDIPNNNKEYPLHLAALLTKGDNRINQRRRLALCTALLKRSFMLVNATTVRSETPLHYAAKSGNIHTVQALLLRGCSVMAKNMDGLTAIQIAAMEGHTEALHQMLKQLKGIKFKREVPQNEPQALHLAARKGHLKCCQIIFNELKEMKVTEIARRDLSGKHGVQLAYENKHYKVFDFLLKKMTYEEYKDDEELLCCIHQYCEESVNSGNIVVIESIISSQWCQMAFEPENCRLVREVNPQPCLTFRNIVAKYPHLACEVLTRHITPADSSSEKEIHNFQPFEYIYFNKDRTPAAPVFTSNDTLAETTEEFDSLNWGQNHPLMEASKRGHMEVLEHKLTKSWINWKLNCYTRWVLYAYVLFDLFTAICTSWLFSILKNDKHVKNSCGMNYTREVMCSSFENNNCTCLCSLFDNQPYEENLTCACTEITGAITTNIAAQTVVLIFFVLTLAFEVNILYRIRDPVRECFSNLRNIDLRGSNFVIFLKSLLGDFVRVYNVMKDYTSMVRYVRLVCLAVVLIPILPPCDVTLGLRGVLQWQIGIISVLLSWLHLVSTINRVPSFTIYMPITLAFVMNFLKIVLHIIIIIFAFSTVFHYLLPNEKAFREIPQSFVKTLVWMVGDLAYDDTFLNEEAQLYYPIQTNILFVVFITTIAGFIVNMVMINSDSKMEKYKVLAKFYQADSSLKLQLLVDDCIPSFRRNWARKKIVFQGEDETYLLPNRKIPVQQTALSHAAINEKDDKSIIHEKLEMLIDDIAELKEEIKNLRKTRKYNTLKNLHETSQSSRSLSYEQYSRSYSKSASQEQCSRNVSQENMHSHTPDNRKNECVKI